MTRARRAAALVVLALLGAPATSSAAADRANAVPILPRGVLVVLVPGVSLERLLRHTAIRALASHGGVAVMPAADDPRRTILEAFPEADLYPLPSATIDPRLLILEQGLGPRPAALGDLDGALQETVARFDVERLFVAVVGERQSSTMRSAKDDLLPVVIGRGRPDALFTSGPLHSLTSNSTRRPGVVVAGDLPPTILSFVGHSIQGNPRGAAETGSPIRFEQGGAPFDLHARYLAMRRMSVPVQTAAGLYVTLAGLFGVGLLALGRRAPRSLLWIGAWLALSAPALATGLLLAGHLPTLSYPTVVPLVIGVTLVGTLAFTPLARRDVLLPPAALGTAVLAALAVEAALGWTAALTPFLGGSELDGGRFYGLPNAFIGLLLGAGLYVAARLPALVGSALLVAAGLFAGLPWTGVNLGAAITLFAAAGLWLVLRGDGRIAPRGLVITVAVTALGTAVILLANRYLVSEPTHVTRFLEGGGGLGNVLRTYGERLLVGWRLIERNPFALVPVLGLPIVLLVVLRPPSAVRDAFAAFPAWRPVVLVTVLGGIVAYLANDSGAAAAGLAFGLALGGLLYVSLAERARKMEAP